VTRVEYRAGFSLVLASGNPGKAGEFARLLGDRFRVEPLPTGLELPAETGTTFAENARLKARAVFDALGGHTPVLADDSGLEVDALSGRPGVLSARYAGECAGDHANAGKLLADLAGVEDRRARFVCVLVMLLPGGREASAQGTLEGEVTREPRGEGGFGYDPVFRPLSWERTLAEASGEEKDAVSHRGDAVRRLLAQLDPGWDQDRG
jgi:XTP/dITP diphosphohydrolase